MHQIQLSYLHIVPVYEPGVAGGASIDGHFLLKAPSLIVVAAGDDGPAILTNESDGAIVGVIGDFPEPVEVLILIWFPSELKTGSKEMPALDTLMTG